MSCWLWLQSVHKHATVISTTARRQFEDNEQEDSKEEDESEDSDEEELQSEIITYMIINDEATAILIFWTLLHCANLQKTNNLHTLVLHM